MGAAPELKRAYSLLTVKALDDEQRFVSGIATTPQPDRVDDIIDADGVTSRALIPFLLYHQQDRPAGELSLERPTGDGIRYRLHIPKVSEPGVFKDRVDEAWHTCKYLRRVMGVSIGYRPLVPPEPIKGTKGYRFPKIEVFEVSLVSVPAHQDASIDLVKSLDVSHPAALGTSAGARISSTPGVSGSPRKDAGMNVSEQLSAKRAELKTKSARFEELMHKGDLSDPEREERDSLTPEVDELQGDVKRLEVLERSQATLAKSVVAFSRETASQSRENSGQFQAEHHVEVRSTLPPGIEFARLVLCKAASFAALMRGEFKNAVDIARERYPDNPRVAMTLKAAVAPATTTDATWAGPLVYASTLATEFVEYLRPMTILGKFGTGNIPALRSAPFNVRIVGQTSGGTGYWVGQAKPKPLTRFDFNAVSLPWAKVAAISVISEETARFSSPSAEGLVRDALTDTLVATMDTDFIDPTKAAEANVSPASITNGLTPIASSGTSADAIRFDIQTLLSSFLTANQNPTGIVLIMPNTVALAAGLLTNGLGQAEFPNLTMNGGVLQGIPVITSQYAAVGSPVSNLVIAINTREVWMSDDGQVTVDVSREASLEMSDAPTQNGAAGTGSTMVSLWQNNLLGLRSERYVNWQKRRATAVQYIEDVAWGAGSPV